MRLLKHAHLRYPDAVLDNTIYDPARKLDTATIERLAACHWIDEGKNLLITGMTSSGKTYLSNALCVSALRQLKTVRYIRANILMLELEQARLKSEYLEYVTSLAKLDLLAIDDFGLMELDLDKCRDLFEVIDGRDGKKDAFLLEGFNSVPLAPQCSLGLADSLFEQGKYDEALKYLEKCVIATKKVQPDINPSYAHLLYSLAKTQRLLEKASVGEFNEKQDEIQDIFKNFHIAIDAYDAAENIKTVAKQTMKVIKIQTGVDDNTDFNTEAEYI